MKSLESNKIPSYLYFLIFIFFLTTLSIFKLDLRFPEIASLSATKDFFSAAINPALSYQDEFVPSTTDSLFLKALKAAVQTVKFAITGTSLGLVLGLLLALLCSRSLGAFRLIFRPLAAFLRSIHELLWAVLLLSAFGVGEYAAIFAIAIPYSGVFAKVFSELFDEHEKESTRLASVGASFFQVFFFSRFIKAFPDILAYSLYRFECAIRASVVLGFFGIPTLGFYISASFENLYYREVWTYLYVLMFLVIAVDSFSSKLRKGVLAR